MQVPVRVLAAVRPREHPGRLLGTAYATAVLGVGPFLLPAVAESYDIGLGLASFSTAVLLLGFVGGSFGAGRRLTPRGRVLGVSLAVAVGANAFSALLPAYPILLVLRFAAGASTGVITWYSWSQVFGDKHRMGEIAAVGPLVSLTTAPAAAFLAAEFGPDSIYAVLAATALVPLLFSRRSGKPHEELVLPRHQDRHPATSDARQILVCLGLLTLGGSAVFTFGAVIAADTTSLSTGAISLSFSANALASVPSARWTGRRGAAGAWLLACAAMAVMMGTVGIGAAFVFAISFWGFAFWMGVPGAYALLADRSRHPEERAGDAQSVMAAGRVVGPLVGGFILDASGPGVLGVAGGSVMAAAALWLWAVQRRQTPPSLTDA